MGDQAPEPCSTNISANELDAETAEKLRGDAIGNTMYSEVFVVKTLMLFSELQWSEEVEDSLCFLWDMTEEQDVCQYLLQVSYPQLACSAVSKYTEPRFIEIVVGILANILCSKCEKNLKGEEIEVVLSLLASNDSYILVQVMRFLHAASFIYDKLDFVTGEHLERVHFVLENSTNRELLNMALKTLAAVTDELKLNHNFINANLLNSAVTALGVCKKSLSTEPELDLFESQDIQANMRYVVKIVCNLTVYVDECDKLSLKTELKSSFSLFVGEVSVLLKFYAQEEYLLPIDEAFTFYIEALTYICKTLNADYEAEIVLPLCQILIVIVKNRDTASLQLCSELLCYFISLGTSECVDDLRRFAVIKSVLLEINNNHFVYDFDYLEHLSNIVYKFE